MIIDDKGRLFGKFNIIDLFVIIVVCLGVFFAIYKLAKPVIPTTSSKTQNILVCLSADEVREEIVSHINQGDEVRDHNKNVQLGVIERVITDVSYSIAQAYDGHFIQTSKPGYRSVKIYVDAKGTYNKNGITLNSVEYSIGSAILANAGDTIVGVNVYDFQERK